MQISKLSLELSTVKHEEAERLYKAQKVTGFVDLDRSIDLHNIADPSPNPSVRFGRRSANVNIRALNNPKAKKGSYQPKSRNRQPSPDVKERDRGRLDPTNEFKQLNERSSSVERVRDDVNVEQTSSELREIPRKPPKGVRRHGIMSRMGSISSDDWNSDDHKLKNASEIQFQVNEVAKLTASPKSLSIKSNSSSCLEGDVARAPSLLMDEEAFLHEPGHSKSNNNSSTLIFADRTTSSEKTVTTTNRSSTALTDALAQQGFNVTLKTGNPKAEDHEDSQNHVNDVSSSPKDTAPKAVVSDTNFENAMSTTKNDRLATTTRSQGSSVLAPDVSGSPQAADKSDRTLHQATSPAQRAAIDQSSFTSTSIPHNQAPQHRENSRWPPFLRSKKNLISNVNGTGVLPSSAGTSRLVTQLILVF